MELRINRKIWTLDNEKVAFVLSRLENKEISSNTNEGELIELLRKIKLLTPCFLENVNNI